MDNTVTRTWDNMTATRTIFVQLRAHRLLLQLSEVDTCVQPSTTTTLTNLYLFFKFILHIFFVNWDSTYIAIAFLSDHFYYSEENIVLGTFFFWK